MRLAWNRAILSIALGLMMFSAWPGHAAPAKVSAEAGVTNLPPIQPLFDYPVRDTCVCVGPDGTYYLNGTTGHPTWWETNEGMRVWKSKDLKTWTNVQEEPVLKCGPDAYDRYAVAFDQVIKYQGRYYAYYHASGHPKWKEWSTNLAVSTDLVHWKKYPGNPVLPADPKDPQRSSAFLVPDGKRFRLYATHPDVKVFVSKQAKASGE